MPTESNRESVYRLVSSQPVGTFMISNERKSILRKAEHPYSGELVWVYMAPDLSLTMDDRLATDFITESQRPNEVWSFS